MGSQCATREIARKMAISIHETMFKAIAKKLKENVPIALIMGK